MKQDRVKHWVSVVRSLNIPCFNVTTQDSEGNKHAPTTTALIGPHCNDILKNYKVVVAATGISDYERLGSCFKRLGPGSVEQKSCPQIKNCLQAAGVKPKGNAPLAALKQLYYQQFGSNCHCCSDHCNQLRLHAEAEEIWKCPESGMSYNYTGDRAATMRVWEAFQKVNVVLRQLEPVSQEQLTQYETDLAEFGEAHVEQYNSTAVTCYVHIIVCHSVQLIKAHGSIGVFANQGVEAAHKLIRQKLNRSNRAGGKHQKSVSLAMLERHHRIEMLRLVHEHEVKVDMVEMEEMHAEEATEEGWVELGASFMELKEDIGELDMSEHKECRIQKRTATPGTLTEFGETFVLAQDNSRRKLQHKGSSAAAVTGAEAATPAEN